MATPREFKKQLRFPYVFAGFAFLYSITHVLNWVLIGYSFSLYMLFTYILPDVAFLTAGVCLILFGRKKPIDTIIPIGFMISIRVINFIYLAFKYAGQDLGEYYVIYSIFSAVFLSLVLLLYILIVFGILRERTLLVIVNGLVVAFEFTLIFIGLIPTYTLVDFFNSGTLIVTINILAILYLTSQAVLSSLPLFYVFSLKKAEPKIVLIGLTIQEKLAMIDKLYLMSVKGEITEAEYIEKKKALLKEI